MAPRGNRHDSRCQGAEVDIRAVVEHREAWQQGRAWHRSPCRQLVSHALIFDRSLEDVREILSGFW